MHALVKIIHSWVFGAEKYLVSFQLECESNEIRKDRVEILKGNLGGEVIGERYKKIAEKWSSIHYSKKMMEFAQ